jgi:hypothetical protein
MPPRGRLVRRTRLRAPVVRKIVHLRWKQCLGRCRSPTGSAVHPPPCTQCWSAAGSTGSPTSTAPPGNRSAATSTTTRVRCCTSRQEARQRPRRPWLALCGPQPRRTQPTRHQVPHRDQGRLLRRQSRHRLRAHRDRRPLPSRLRRDPRRRDRRHRDRGAAQRRGWFAECGVSVGRVLSDNGSAYRSHLWRDTCAETGHHAEEGPALPTPDQRQERFHRTMADAWAFKKFYNSESAPARNCASKAPRVQPPSAPHRNRQVSTDYPVNQPHRSVQLAAPASTAVQRSCKTGRGSSTRASVDRHQDSDGSSGRGHTTRRSRRSAPLRRDTRQTDLDDVRRARETDDQASRNSELQEWTILAPTQGGPSG